MTRWSLLVIAVILAACSGASPDAGPSPTPPTPAPTPAPTDGAGVPDTDAPIVASWDIGAPGVELPDGSVAVHCEGDAPLLCIERDGAAVGLLELFDYELTPEFEAAAADDLDAALRAWADEHLEWVKSDRAAGCGDGYTFEAEPTRSTRLGMLPALQVGFTGTEGGVVTEHVRLWSTVAGGKRWIVTAQAASPDGCMASDELLVFEPAVMARMLPILDRVVAGTLLPGIEAGIEDGAVVSVDGGLDGGLVYVVVDGRKQRIQQPRAMTYADVTTAGLEPGETIPAVRLADTATGSYFVVVPPDGPDARLHLVVDGTIHPVLIREADHSELTDVPEVAHSVLDRLHPAS